MLGSLAAGVLVASCAGSPEPGSPDPSSPAVVDPATAPATDPAWVTLVTGDRVRVVVTDRTPATTFVPAHGRDGISVTTTVRRGHVYVTPDDAAALVAAGRLDPELFDVSALIKLGYDDAHRGSVPVIVTYGSAAAGGVRRAASTRARAMGAQVTRALPGIGGEAMEIAKDKAADVWGSLGLGAAAGQARRAVAPAAGEVKKVWLDRVYHLTLDHSVPQIGAPAAWAAGYTGKGVAVAVLDSGIDDTHPDFAGKIAEARNFTSEDGTSDRLGHGTHVASIIAGTGAASSGRYRGVAPDAQLLIGKVCTGADVCQTSWILAAMEWAAIDKGARIVNLSLGNTDTPGLDPVEEEVNRLSAERGTLFVIAAGNTAPGDDVCSVSSPGSADAALTVGAVDGTDALASFSCTGPRVGDGGLKPDITAPGVGIVAAAAAGSALGQIGEIVDGVYLRLSGTSMATPHVAGAAALLVQQHPDWPGAELKAALMGAARPNPALTAFEQGAGRLDVAAVITRPIFASPASLSLGVAQWPHSDDPPIDRTVTYTNTSGAPVSLALGVTAQGPDGQPAAAGMFAVSPTAITVPAHGSASVEVMVDTRGNAADGAYSASLSATTATGVVSTVPLVIQREAEAYNLSLLHLDQNGAPATTYQTHIDRLDGPEQIEVFAVDSSVATVAQRLPRGRYFVYTVITTSSGAGGHESILVQPSLSLSADTTETLDSRAATPMHVTVPWPGAKTQSTSLGFRLSTETLATTTVWTFPGGGTEGAIGQIGPMGPAGEVTVNAGASLAELGPAGDFDNSPRVYFLTWPQSGFSGIDKQFRASDLTVVHAEFRASAPGQRAAKIALPVSIGGNAETSVFSLPFQRTECYSANPNGWYRLFDIDGGELNATDLYRPGTRAREVWNQAVLAPGFPGSAPVSRTGDTMSGNLSLLGDTGGHAGTDLSATGVTRLFRGSDKLGEIPRPGRLAFFSLAADPATYRLETEVVRTAPTLVQSTRVTAAWTFTSQHTAAATALPLLALQFTPPVDDRNRAPAGIPFVVPVSVARMPGTPASDIVSLSLEASYDDGATWHRAFVVGRGPTRAALVFHPAHAAFVSLRGTASDAAGNRVEQTVIHAYALR